MSPQGPLGKCEGDIQEAWENPQRDRQLQPEHRGLLVQGSFYELTRSAVPIVAMGRVCPCGVVGRGQGVGCGGRCPSGCGWAGPQAGFLFSPCGDGGLRRGQGGPLKEHVLSMEHVLSTAWAEAGPLLGWVLFPRIRGQLGTSTAFLAVGLTREFRTVEF